MSGFSTSAGDGRHAPIPEPSTSRATSSFGRDTPWRGPSSFYETPHCTSRCGEVLSSKPLSTAERMWAHHQIPPGGIGMSRGCDEHKESVRTWTRCAKCSETEAVSEQSWLKWLHSKERGAQSAWVDKWWDDYDYGLPGSPSSGSTAMSLDGTGSPRSTGSTDQQVPESLMPPALRRSDTASSAWTTYMSTQVGTELCPEITSFSGR